MANKGNVLARNTELRVKNSGGTYLSIGSLRNLGVSYEEDKQDTTSNDTDGWKTHLVSLKGASMNVEAYKDEDCATGEVDEGQAEILELNQYMGCDALGDFQLVHKVTGAVISEFRGSVNITGRFGDTGSIDVLNFTITVYGPLTIGIAPTALVASPAVVSLAVGEISELIKAVFTPTNTSFRSVSYSTDDANVAVVTSTGNIIGIGVGTCTVTLTSDKDAGVTGTVAVTVA